MDVEDERVKKTNERGVENGHGGRWDAQDDWTRSGDWEKRQDAKDG